MSETDPPGPPTESDPRFPSGPWTGFFLQKELPGRHWMELRLNFSQGVLTGEGRDKVGTFLVKGRYHLEDGSCHWNKSYVGRHDVFYSGFNEGRGIWGTWEIAPIWKGGFYIWPEGMPDPTQQRLAAEADLPAGTEPAKPVDPEPVPDEEEPIPAGAGADDSISKNGRSGLNALACGGYRAEP